MTDRATTSWDELITDYLTFLAAAGRPASTVGLRGDQLGYAARCLAAAPDEVSTQELVAWCAGQSWAPETRRSYRAALRGFFGWAAQTGRIEADAAAGLPVVRAVPGVPRPVPDELWCPAAASASLRIRLMLRLAAQAGLRRAEIARLHTADLLDAAEGPVLLVHGKGDRTRLVPVTASLAAVIGAGPAGHTDGAPSRGWVFPNRVGDGPLSAEWVGELCAAVLPESWTLHSLRHRYATRAYAGSRDLRAVQILLGHSSLVTTQRYVAVCDEDVRRAAMFAAG